MNEEFQQQAEWSNTKQRIYKRIDFSRGQSICSGAHWLVLFFSLLFNILCQSQTTWSYWGGHTFYRSAGLYLILITDPHVSKQDHFT